jgi:hypothetical protein
MSTGIVKKSTGQEPLTVAISGPAGDIERLLAPGTHVFGGALSADVVLPTHNSAEIFAVTRAAGDGSFSVKILTEGVIVNGMLVPSGHKLMDLTSVKIESSAHNFDIHIVLPPKVSLKDRIGSSTSGLRSGIGNMEMGGKLNSLTESGQGYLQDLWKRNPQAVIALMLAVGLVFIASVTPVSFGGAMIGSSRPLPVLPHLQPITTQNMLLEELRRRAQAAELIPQITISPSVDGHTVALSGAINSNENVRLAEIIANLRGRLRAPLTIDSAVSFAPPEDRHGIAGIVLTPQKAVAVETGDLISIGETLPTGWRVVSIDEAYVELMRDGLSQKIPVAGQELRRTLPAPATAHSTNRP